MTGNNLKSNLIWITGLAGSGKTTIGKEVYSILKKKNINTVFLDGDHFREISRQTSSHTRDARLQVAHQIAQLCKFLIQQDINVVCSTISLFAEIHEFNRSYNNVYTEVYVNCDMNELIRRDQKNLYTKALNKEITDVVGVDIPYDKPLLCDIIIDNTRADDLNKKVNSIINLINKKNETR